MQFNVLNKINFGFGKILKKIKYLIRFVLTWYDFLCFERLYGICVDLNIFKTFQINSKFLSIWRDSKTNHDCNVVLMICKHFN